MTKAILAICLSNVLQNGEEEKHSHNRWQQTEYTSHTATNTVNHKGVNHRIHLRLYKQNLSSRAITLSIPIPIRSDNAAPIKLNVITNTRAIIPTKHGIALYFPVKIRSIDILRLCSWLSWGRTTVFAHRASINKNLILASAASRSSPVSTSNTETRCSNMSDFSGKIVSFSLIKRSCSISFITVKRTGNPFSFASGSNICTVA